MEEKDIRLAIVLWNKRDDEVEERRITLPVSWIRDMGLSEDIKSMDINYDEDSKTISIKRR